MCIRVFPISNNTPSVIPVSRLWALVAVACLRRIHSHRLSCSCFRPQRSQSWQTTESHCHLTCRGWQRSRLWIWDFRMNGKTSVYPAEGQYLRRMRSGGGMDMVRLTFKTYVFLNFKEIILNICLLLSQRSSCVIFLSDSPFFFEGSCAFCCSFELQTNSAIK